MNIEKKNDGVELKIGRFFVIVIIIFLLEMPGCIIVLADDAGQISYFEHKAIIEFSKKTFAAPLIKIVGPVGDHGTLLLIYIGNVLLLAVLVSMIIHGLKSLIK